MDTPAKNPPQRLLRILFFICETIFIATFAAGEMLVQRNNRTAGAFGFLFLISLVALLVVCFCLRRTARKLAVIGWITAFILFWYAALTPEL